MDEQERCRRWDNYPDVPNGILEEKREIESINDISVECKNIDFGNYPPIKECIYMGDTNVNENK